MPPIHFTEATTAYWQHIVEPSAVSHPDAPWQFGYPAQLPDGRVLMLPIRQLELFKQKIALEKDENFAPGERQAKLDEIQRKLSELNTQMAALKK